MTKQRINCAVTNCIHHVNDNCCNLTGIQIAEWEGQKRQAHESQCANFQCK
ncbi:MAG: DUF1540 domain-containing protein [Bacillota bacterium]|nr:DUF1540 domain-containing protein [Bacillota bacterium]